MEAVNDNDDHQPTSDDAEGGLGGTRRRCQRISTNIQCFYFLKVLLFLKMEYYLPLVFAATVHKK